MRSVSLNFANALKNATRDGIVPRWLISIAAKTYAADPADAVEVMRSFSTHDDVLNIDVISTRTGLITTRQFIGGVNLEVGRIPRVSELKIQQVEVTMSATAPAVNDFIRSNNLKGARVEIWVQLLSPQSRVPVAVPELAWLGIIDGAPIDEGDDGVLVSLTVVNEAMVMLTRTNPAKSSHEEGKRRLLPDGREDDFSKYAGSVKDWKIPWGEGLMITLKRKELWLSAYHDELELIRRTPFSWAAHECASGLAARVIKAVTGVDLASPYAGRYDDAVSAYRTLRSTGFADLADFAASVLPEYEHPVDAHIADIAAIPIHTPFRHVLGVFNGERIWVLTEAGLGSVDRAAAVRAFKVG